MIVMCTSCAVRVSLAHIHMRVYPGACQVASDQVARALKVGSGALIQSVTPGSAAAKAGLLATRRYEFGHSGGGIIAKLRGSALKHRCNRSRMTQWLIRRPLKLEVQGSSLGGSTPLSR